MCVCVSVYVRCRCAITKCTNFSNVIVAEPTFTAVGAIVSRLMARIASVCTVQAIHNTHSVPIQQTELKGTIYSNEDGISFRETLLEFFQMCI